MSAYRAAGQPKIYSVSSSHDPETYRIEAKSLFDDIVRQLGKYGKLSPIYIDSLSMVMCIWNGPSNWIFLLEGLANLPLNIVTKIEGKRD